MNALTIWVCEGAYEQTRGIIVSHAQHDSLICLLASAVLYVNKSNPLHGKQHFFLCTSAKICIQRIVTLLQFFITEYLDALWTGQIQTLIFRGTIFVFGLASLDHLRHISSFHAKNRQSIIVAMYSSFLPHLHE